MPQQPPAGLLVIDRHVILVYIIHHNGFDPIRLLRQNQAAVIFHHLVGTRPEKSGVGPAFLAGHGVLGLVPVAIAGGGLQNRHRIQLFAAHAVEASPHPLRFQAALLLIVHVPEIAAPAELGHRTGPVHPMGGFFQNFRDFSRGPGLAHQGDFQPYPLPGDGIGDEYGAALNMGNALALGGIVGDLRFIDLIFD